MNDQLTISNEGIALIKEFEGCFLEAYKCPAGVWTIGYGHTGLTHQVGSVKRGLKITAARAVELLQHDLTGFGDMVRGLVKVTLTQPEFDALVSFHFNTGALNRSTLLKLLNAGNHIAAADEFLKWTRGGGRVLRGLVRRRKAERLMFLGRNWRE